MLVVSLALIFLSAAFAVDGAEASSASTSADPVLVGAGDIGYCGSAGDEATAALLDGIEGSVFTAGDNAYESGTTTEFANCYEPSWGRHKARTRPAPGNHDYKTAGATDYFQYFGALAGDSSRGYYAYDLGTWRIYSLNSNCSKIGGCAVGSPQEQWLRADLAANPRQCVAAYWHHPRFSSGLTHGDNTAVAPLYQALYDHHADLVVAGHEHNYERFAPQRPDGTRDDALGIRQIVAGTGGKSHYGFGTIKANSEVRNSDTYGVLKLTLHATAYEWHFVPEAGRTFTDAGSQACHDAAGLITPPPSTPAPTDTPMPTETALVTGAPTPSDSASPSPTDGPSPSATDAPSPSPSDLLSPSPSDLVSPSPLPADVIAPDTTITAGPAETIAGSSASFDFSSNETGSTFECALDGEGFAACASPQSYTGLAEGPHTFEVRATDSAGNVDTTPASRTWTIANPQTLALAPEADAHVQEASPTKNYGTATSLRVDGAADPDIESYLRFSLSGVNGTVQSAKLRVFASNGTPNGPGLHGAATTWSETAITWSNRPARAATATDDKGSIATGTWVEYNVTALVTGNGTYSFALIPQSTDRADFYSREGGANRPQLVVTTSGGERDMEAPSAPTNVTATAVSSVRVDLSWSASTDNAGVTGYEVYRGGALLATVGSVTSYSDVTVSALTAYSYTVKARDAAGNVSGASNTASVTTPAAGSTPQTLTFAPEADAYVQEASPSRNYGTATSLRADGGSDLDVESYLRFSVSGVNGTVQSAKLRLYAWSGTANGPALHGAATTWSETAITWSNRPTRAATATDDKGSIAGGIWVEYNVTVLVSANGTYSFALVPQSNDGVDFYSREAGSNRPQIVVTFQ